MAIRVAVEHRTVYRFDRPTDIGPHLVRLRPAPHCRTPILGYSLKVTPEPHFVNWQQDVYGNHAARLVFPEPARELSITVDLVADLAVVNPFDFFVDEEARQFPFEYPPGLADDLEPYLRPVTESGGVPPLLPLWLNGFDPDSAKGTPIVDFLVALNRRVAGDVAYSVRMEEGVLSPSQTLQRGIGSCRDSAWLLVGILRELGMAARFVSGYLVQLVPDDPSQMTSGAMSTDFTDLHAWAEVYVPGAGWIGLDATSGLLAGEGHIPLVGTPRPEQAAAITGTTGPSQTVMEYSNTVRRLHEDPRVTKPYSQNQLERIHALGAAVDARLLAGDVRLTMGGEPTFVAADDMESAQWRIAADGEDKRAYAVALAARLQAHYAPRGVVLHTQGKWYPGEALPRWAIALYWRSDHVALWSDPARLDDPWSEPALEPGSPAAAVAVANLTAQIAAGLGVPADCIRALYEDPLDRLTAEARLPEGPPPAHDPAAGALSAALWPATAQRRHAVVADLDAERGEPAAWAIPLGRTEDGAAWTTTQWRTRRAQVYLRPGTSPAGLRLPLDALAWTPPPATYELSPFAPSAPLPAPPVPAAEPAPAAQAAEVLPVEGAPTTALCVEERGGHLFVFLPPLPDSADTVALLGIVEAAAVATGNKVVLEGYPPSGDHRLRSLSVTPDPGVIEVNVHPAASWAELTEINQTLDTAARAVGLATETFGMDGTHTGTGGGGHLTLGGPSSADSPLLRRPDLLVSMLTYWQHHPGLTYLFAGRFIGPTSQAPRADEGRPENLYELEIAFAELAALAESPEGARPWHVDRALRHLLTDITGNTHRSEFCIDKLFSPDSERGRLGLLELRGFEMPPHPDLSLVQVLLVRSLVARFWETPYSGPLVRWGTRLHDSFLLPEFALADVADVAADLNAHGIAFSPAWLDPFAEFRFPRLGSVDVAGVHVELRLAIEPWHVLGEEVSGGGTARYVDSSVERLQVKVTGAVPGRHAVTCNGVPLPLTRARGGDAMVAGVRFRAWAPPSALHPTIGVHSPLVFDVVDTWNGHAVGGCTYHVTHPGGRAYTTFPVNPGEAEARRGARFVPEGHTPGPVDPAAWESAWHSSAMHPSPATSLIAGTTADAGEYPRTLDLRRIRPRR